MFYHEKTITIELKPCPCKPKIQQLLVFVLIIHSPSTGQTLPVTGFFKGVQ